MQEPRAILPGSSRKPAAGARLIGRTDAATPVEVTVVLKRKAEIPQDELQRHVLTSPHARPSADHAAFAAQYGASDDGIAAVRALAAQHGLTVTNVDQRRRVVKLSGPASNMEQAFGTELNEYSIGPHSYRGRQGPVLLPTAVAPHVEAVLGLDNRPVAKPRMRPRAAQISYYPNELAALYNFPAGDGAGQSIALIELGGNLGTTDLQSYFAAAGLARTPTVQPVSVTQGVPVPYGQDTLSDGEVMLDIEVVGAMAPGATVVVYFAENTDQGFYEAVSQAVHHPATTAVSISWGSPEKHWTDQTMNAWATLCQGAALLNVPIFVAAGDHGCTDEEPTDDGYDGQRHVDFPGTCRDGVVSCGGTSVQAGAHAIANETVWNEGDGWATGGGVSTHFQIPAWQDGIAAEGGTLLRMRGVPDVAANADSRTGIKIRVNGGDSVSGGTSASAPQWAALAAILSQQLGKKVGFFLPLLYRNAGATNVVVSGDNTVFGVAGFAAKAGWNACTGLGSPDGNKLLALLSGPGRIAAPVPTAGPTPTAVVAGGVNGGTPQPASPAPRTAQAFNPAAAVRYGRFVMAAYSMYDADQSKLTPPPSADFPAGYHLSAWILMKDFVFGSTGPKFYGFIAQSQSDGGQFILAIRGTSTPTEWWDDLTASAKTTFKDPGTGSVGYGFARIYDTLEVVENSGVAAAATAATAPRSLKSVGGFAQQVSALVTRHAAAAAAARAQASTPSASVVVAGHSLGSALATLYVLDNARNDRISNPLLCTFASPRVGDATFVASFNGLGLTTWRIVNTPDLVPKLPPEFFGFSHVDVLQAYDSSGTARPSLTCCHAMATYLSLLDPALKPDAACQLAATGVQAQAVVEPPQKIALSVPAGAMTINININPA